MPQAPNPKAERARRGGAWAMLRALWRRLRDTTGATTVEHVLVMSVALSGAVGFKELGTKLHSQLDREADHIEGKGMPKNGDLASLAASFRTPDLDCPGGSCAPSALAHLPSTSDSQDGQGTAPASGATRSGTTGSRAGGTSRAGAPVAAAVPVGSGAATSNPLPWLTRKQKQQFEECVKELQASPQTYAQLPKRAHRRKDFRPPAGQAIALLCLEMVCECPAEKTDDQCLKQWACIYGHVAQNPSTEYFDRMRVSASDNQCPDTASTPNANVEIQAQCLDKQIERWACYKDPILDAHGNPVFLDEHGKPFPPIPPYPHSNPDRDGGVSQAGGEEAARNFAAQLAGYDCVEAGGSDVFDMLCLNGDSVVIIEAKGGTANIEKRQNAEHTRYVQQGTKEYALAITAEMTARAGRLRTQAAKTSNPAAKSALLAEADELERQAAAVEKSIDEHTARYFKITQSFDGTGAPKDPVLAEFDLDNPDTVCRNCDCGTTTAAASHAP